MVLNERVRMVESKLDEVDKAVQIVVDRMRSFSEWTKSLEGKLSEAGKPEVKLEVVPVPHIFVEEDILNSRNRSPQQVLRRWRVWRAMALAGLSDKEIARRFKCHRATIRYARTMNWNPSYVETPQYQRKR